MAPFDQSLERHFNLLLPPSTLTSIKQLPLIRLMRIFNHLKMKEAEDLMVDGQEKRAVAEFQRNWKKIVTERDWEGQIDHIYDHLMEIAKEDQEFKRSIGATQLGQINSAELEELSDNYTLTITFEKPHQPRRLQSASKYESSNTRRTRGPSKHQQRQQESDAIEEKVEYEKEDYPQEGTLKAYKNFDPQNDADALRKAMKGLGTDEATITGILGKRSGKQRLEIVKTFKSMFGKDLGKDLKSELSGNYWKVIRALLNAPEDYDAMLVRNAVKGMGTDDACLIEIICTRTNKSIKAIQSAYKRCLSIHYFVFFH